MAPIAPKRLKTPILLGGPHAEAFAPMPVDWALSTEVFSDEVGRASAVKLSRSIFVKGLEAIVTESLASARHFGVEAEVWPR
jgi:3-hydroxyisobutyrate dehydrogenase-like beta-hydroxyacid dehydrogenase